MRSDRRGLPCYVRLARHKPTERREMTHGTGLSASSALLWLDGHFCPAPVLCRAVKSELAPSPRGGGVNTFHLVQ